MARCGFWGSGQGDRNGCGIVFFPGLTNCVCVCVDVCVCACVCERKVTCSKEEGVVDQEEGEPVTGAEGRGVMRRRRRRRRRRRYCQRGKRISSQ